MYEVDENTPHPSSIPRRTFTKSTANDINKNRTIGVHKSAAGSKWLKMAKRAIESNKSQKTNVSDNSDNASLEVNTSIRSETNDINSTTLVRKMNNLGASGSMNRNDLDPRTIFMENSILNLDTSYFEEIYIETNITQSDCDSEEINSMYRESFIQDSKSDIQSVRNFETCNPDYSTVSTAEVSRDKSLLNDLNNTSDTNSRYNMMSCDLDRNSLYTQGMKSDLQSVNNFETWNPDYSTVSSGILSQDKTLLEELNHSLDTTSQYSMMSFELDDNSIYIRDRNQTKKVCKFFRGGTVWSEDDTCSVFSTGYSQRR